MKELEMLEAELKMIQDNIDRVKKYVEHNKKENYRPWNSRVFGELKHRLIAFKQRATIISKLSTYELFK